MDKYDRLDRNQTTRRNYQIGGFLFTSALGTILHFLFDWTGDNNIIASISAVNESVWEHMKIMFIPLFLYGIFEYFRWGRDQMNFWCIKLTGILLTLIIIPTVYYTYTGALFESKDWINITIYYVAAFIAYWVETKLWNQGKDCIIPNKVCFFILILILIMFIVFTYAPPKIPLFQDPLTGQYGI